MLCFVSTADLDELSVLLTASISALWCERMSQCVRVYIFRYTVIFPHYAAQWHSQHLECYWSIYTTLDNDSPSIDGLRPDTAK